MLKKAVAWFGSLLGKKAPAEAPAPAPIPVAEPEVDPMEEVLAGLAAEATARIDELHVLEVEAVTDSLRGKYRAAREEAERWRERHAKAWES